MRFILFWGSGVYHWNYGCEAGIHSGWHRKFKCPVTPRGQFRIPLDRLGCFGEVVRNQRTQSKLTRTADELAHELWNLHSFYINKKKFVFALKAVVKLIKPDTYRCAKRSAARSRGRTASAAATTTKEVVSFSPWRARTELASSMDNSPPALFITSSSSFSLSSSCGQFIFFYRSVRPLIPTDSRRARVTRSVHETKKSSSSEKRWGN